MKRDKTVKKTTQDYLEISEIREDSVILRDGTLRVVILVSSLNFSLKSLEEQDAIIAAYMSFLNSFDFSIQILIQSRRVDMNRYLSDLKQIEKTQTNELLRLQTQEYGNYIKELVEIGDIMTKRFYVIVPYNPASDKKKGFWPRFGEIFSSASIIQLNEKQFQKRRRELFLRVGHIISGLNSIGLQAVPLDTQALIELYYNTYNPENSIKTISPIENLQFEESEL